MAKDGRKNSAKSSLQQIVVSDARYLGPDQLGGRGDFELLALRRQWKERVYDLSTHYDKTPLREREWWKLRDIAGEYARTPGTVEVDDEKRGRMVDFLCRAIYRGELKDGKGRMQVANLHPSSLSPMRLDVKWLAFNQLLKLADYLFVRRKECIECFSRNNVDFPKAWLLSELTGPDVPNTRSLPAQTIVDQAAPRTDLVHWLKNEVSQLTAAGKLPDRITDCARRLEARLSTADKSLRRVKARHIENTLRTYGLFPKTRRK